MTTLLSLAGCPQPIRDVCDSIVRSISLFKRVFSFHLHMWLSHYVNSSLAYFGEDWIYIIILETLFQCLGKAHL